MSLNASSRCITRLARLAHCLLRVGRNIFQFYFLMRRILREIVPEAAQAQRRSGFAHVVLDFAPTPNRSACVHSMFWLI